MDFKKVFLEKGCNYNDWISLNQTCESSTLLGKINFRIRTKFTKITKSQFIHTGKLAIRTTTYYCH